MTVWQRESAPVHAAMDCELHGTIGEHSIARDVNNAVDFDSPFLVVPGANGAVTVLTYPHTGQDAPYPPEPRIDASGDLRIDGTENGSSREGWQLVDGYSGQHAYSGPVMHASEQLGGGMARDLLAGVMGTGWFVVVAVESDTCDDFTLYGECGVSADADVHQCSDEPAGWMLLHKPVVFK